MKSNHLLFLIFIFVLTPSYGQVGIGTTTPDMSSILHVFSKDKGVLFPRLTNIQRDAITNPAQGLTIYNLDESCLQVNTGFPNNPFWSCVGNSSSSPSSTSMLSNCSQNGFSGNYINSIPLTNANTFSLTITNHTFNTASINFSTDDLKLNGISGVSVSAVNPTSATILSGQSQTIEYTLMGTPNGLGFLTGVWSKLGLTCSSNVYVGSGDAIFTLPQTAFVASVNDGTPVVDIQGIIDNSMNQLIVYIPYTNGFGTYEAYTSNYISNNSGTSEGGDANSFRISYPAGTFASSGNITATIEVDGDGTFNAKKQLFGDRKTIASLDFIVNNNSKGSVNLDIIGATSSSLQSNCDTNGFEGEFVYGVPLSAANKFSLEITNYTINSANINFDITDLSLSGISGITVSSVSPASVTISPGESQIVEYTLTGTPDNSGTLTGVWNKLGMTCSNTTNVLHGYATFNSLPSTYVSSINDGSPVVNIQGIIDNQTNQLTVNIPYTGGVGSYLAYSGTYIANIAGTGEDGDLNSFRLTYPSGVFSSTGNITVTIEVDGDGSFNAKKQLFGVQETIAALDFQVNGNSHGNITITNIGGIIDRNFEDANHKFLYLPVVTANGSTWLNNNLGANYSNINHAQYNLNQQATAYNDFNAYGSLYQWGRYSDGHELINWTSSTTGNPVHGTTSTNTSSDTPLNNLFITETNLPLDWRIPKNDNLWQGESGTNNPCPKGYRIPTETEFNTLITSESITNYTSANNSSLSFTTPGSRNQANGNLIFTGNDGNFWFNTTNGDYSKLISISQYGTVIHTSGARSTGYTVRCIKN